MAFDLPPLPPTEPDWATFQVWWDQLRTGLISTLTEIAAVAQAAQDAADAALAAQTAATAAQTTADTAQADATAAQADADAAAREAARLASYPVPTNVLTAADMGGGTGAKITVANHTRGYPVQGSIDVPDLSITGADITGLAYSTAYYVYYDDTTLADSTPNFQTTTTFGTAQVGSAAGRHYLGKVTTPASGGGGTTGGGAPRPPGAGEDWP